MTSRLQRPGQQGGFILIYVVVMVAALATLVYQIGQFRNAIPRKTERQLGYALEGQEIRQLEDFVILGIDKHDVPVDPRFLAYLKLQEDDPRSASDRKDALAQIKAMLAEFNFKINVPDAETDESTTSTQPARSQSHDGNSNLFAPGARPYTLELGTRRYTITVTPANAIPNLNSITFDPLSRYLALLLKIEPGEARQLAANLIDWRDADSFRTESIGAENETYQPLGYSPRNAPIRNWQELAYVHGIQPEYLRTIRDNFYLAPGDASARVLPDYLPPAALAALTDLRPDVIRALLDLYERQLDPDTPRKESTTQTEDAEQLFGPDATRFDDAVSWQSDVRRLRIKIDGPNRSSTLDYDVTNRTVTDRWD